MKTALPILIAASVGLALAIAISITHNAPVSAIAARALFSGALFGSLYVAARAVIARKLPELLEQEPEAESSQSAASEEEGAPESRINIMLSDEDEAGGADAGQADGAQTDFGLKKDTEALQSALEKKKEAFAAGGPEKMAKMIRTALSKDDD